MLTGEMLKSLK